MMGIPRIQSELIRAARYNRLSRRRSLATRSVYRLHSWQSDRSTEETMALSSSNVSLAPGVDAVAPRGSTCLNALLHNAVAGAEVYGQTIKRLQDSKFALPCLGLLRQFQEEHELIAEVYRNLLPAPAGDV